MSKQTNPISFRIDSNDNKMFQKMYPYCLSRFIKNCIKKAISDPKFFRNMFFLSEVE